MPLTQRQCPLAVPLFHARGDERTSSSVEDAPSARPTNFDAAPLRARSECHRAAEGA